MQPADYKTLTRSEEETRALGRRIGKHVTRGTVIGLSGSLGTGKTRLVQGIGEGLGIAPDLIVSPTYTICVPYEGRLSLLHLDVYRINDVTEIDELGLDELVDEGAVVVIEWADRMQAVLPPSDIEIIIRTGSGGPNEREIEIRANRQQQSLIQVL